MTAAQQQPAVNAKALGWTIGVHALLFLLFWLWHYTLPVTVPVEEQGMEVNLGTSDNGSGTDQPMNTEDPSQYQASVSYNSVSASGAQATNLMQSNDADAPSVNTNNSTEKNNASADSHRRNADQQQVNDERARRQQPKYVYAGANGKGGNSAIQNMPGKSEGNTTGPGDRGVPGGTPGAANYTGSPGNGNGGISHTLSGRQITPDRFEASFHEGGKVVISVTVDRQGNIVAKRIKSSPSEELSRIALQKLGQARFSANPDAEPQQFGTVTIVFKTRS